MALALLFAATVLQTGSAAPLLETGKASGKVPPGQYDCRAGADPYATLEVFGDAYTWLFPNGGKTKGVLSMQAGGVVIWQGALGPIASAAHRPTGARASAQGDILTIAFDFTGPAPNQLVCQMRVAPR